MGRGRAQPRSATDQRPLSPLPPTVFASYEAQIREFGQCPKQLFARAHPRRDDPPLPTSGEEAKALVDVPPPGPDPTAKPGTHSAGVGAEGAAPAAAAGAGVSSSAGATGSGKPTSEQEQVPLSGAQKLLGSLTQRLRIGQGGEEVSSATVAEAGEEAEGEAATIASEGTGQRRALSSALTEEQRARLRAAEEQYASDAQGESGQLAPSRMALSTLRAAASVAPRGSGGGGDPSNSGQPLSRGRAVTEGGDEVAGLRLRGDHWTKLAHGTATVPLALHRAPVTCVVLRRQRGRRQRLGEGLLAGMVEGDGDGESDAAQGSDDSFVAYTTSEDSTLKLAEVRPQAEMPRGGAAHGVHAEVPDGYRAFGDAMRHLQSASTLPVGAQWVQKRSVSVSSLSLAACAVPAMVRAAVLFTHCAPRSLTLLRSSHPRRTPP